MERDGSKQSVQFVENERKTMNGWLARTLRGELKTLGFDGILEN